MTKDKLNEKTCADTLDEILDNGAPEETAGEEVAAEAAAEINQPDETANLKAQIAEATDKYLRLAADFDNFRKRTLKEKSELTQYAQSEIVEKILPVLDNFIRAIDSLTDDSPFKEGIQMVQRQLIKALEDAGLSEIEALNQKFDPVTHYAVMTENDETKEYDTVTEVLQKGYTFKQKIIRPAMVRVNKK